MPSRMLFLNPAVNRLWHVDQHDRHSASSCVALVGIAIALWRKLKRMDAPTNPKPLNLPGPPPTWATDPLTSYFEITRHQKFATFVNMHPAFEKMRQVDATFVAFHNKPRLRRRRPCGSWWPVGSFGRQRQFFAETCHAIIAPQATFSSRFVVKCRVSPLRARTTPGGLNSTAYTPKAQARRVMARRRNPERLLAFARRGARLRPL
jgi:hypothetical protein